jgi:circadian clock protein KaiB
MEPKITENTERPMDSALDGNELPYLLRLYVAGLTPRSTQAISALRALCEEYLVGQYRLEVFDLYQQPELARRAQLLAAPTLVKELPLPVRRLIGDLSDKHVVLRGLGLGPAVAGEPQRT